MTAAAAFVRSWARAAQCSAPALAPEQRALWQALTVREVCREDGVPTRLVRLSGDEACASLRAPAVLCVHDEPPLLLLRAGPFHALLQRADGRRLRWTRARVAARFAGLALELRNEPPGPRALWRLLRELPRAERRLLRRAIFSALAVAALAATIPKVVGIALDRALPEGAQDMLAWIAAAVLFVSLQRAGLGWLKERSAQDLSAMLEQTTLASTLRRLLTLPYVRIAHDSVGEQLQRVEAAQSLVQGLTGSLVTPLLDACISLGYGLALWMALPKAALLAFATCLLLSLLSLWAGPRSAQTETVRLAAHARAQAQLYELISGALAFKVAGAERSGIKRWLKALIEERTALVRAERTEQSLQAATSAVQRLAGLAVVGFGGYSALDGELSFGALAAALMLADGLTATFGRVVSAGVALWSLQAPWQSLALLDGELPPAAPDAAEDDADVVVLEHVWFRYGSDQRWVLRDACLRVSRCRIARLPGASGAGKTTSLRLIAGLLRPERGQVRVFGRDPTASGEAIFYLPQDLRLLEGSLLANLTALAGASVERVLEAAQRTGLIELVASLPMGFETLIPPGGSTFSGGQRQWIALTAAVASHSPLVLLDEPLSQVDALTRARLDLAQLFAGRTVIEVTHEP